MALLAAVKIWITVVVYNGLGNLDNLVTDWITGAFSEHPNEFNAIESAVSIALFIIVPTLLRYNLAWKKDLAEIQLI